MVYNICAGEHCIIFPPTSTSNSSSVQTDKQASESINSLTSVSLHVVKVGNGDHKDVIMKIIDEVR